MEKVFCENLKKERKRSNLTQSQLAEKINTTYASINRYELGLTEPNLTKLKQLAQIFNVSLDYLLGVEKKQNVEDVPKYTAKQQEAIKTILLLNDANLDKIIERAKTLKELE